MIISLAAIAVVRPAGRGACGPARSPARASALVACDALALSPPAPYLHSLRAQMLQGLTELQAPSEAALRREGQAIFDRKQYGLVLSVCVFLLALKLARRSALPVAASSFALTRLGCAAISRRPDPRRLVPWGETGRTAARAVSMFVRAAFLATFGLLMGLGSTYAAAELTGRVCYPQTLHLLSAASNATAAEGATAIVVEPAVRAQQPAQEVAEDLVNRLEDATGLDLDGDGFIGNPAQGKNADEQKEVSGGEGQHSVAFGMKYDFDNASSMLRVVLKQLEVIHTTQEKMRSGPEEALSKIRETTGHEEEERPKPRRRRSKPAGAAAADPFLTPSTSEFFSIAEAGARPASPPRRRRRRRAHPSGEAGGSPSHLIGRWLAPRAQPPTRRVLSPLAKPPLVKQISRWLGVSS